MMYSVSYGAAQFKLDIYTQIYRATSEFQLKDSWWLFCSYGGPFKVVTCFAASAWQSAKCVVAHALFLLLCIPCSHSYPSVN